MQVILFVLIIMPGVIAAKRYETFTRANPSTCNFVYHTAAFTCVIALANLLAMHLRGWKAYTFDTLSVGFIEKYLIADLLLVLTLPWLAFLITQSRKSQEIFTGGGYRKSWIDFAKVTGLAMIILAHVSPPNILFQIRNFDVPFMVFLSGILAADSLKREKKKAAYRFSGYIRKRVSRLLLPTWCFLGFYFVALHMLGVQFSSAVIMKSFLLQHDSIGYVWVIWIYLMCGIMVPFFDRISTHRLLMLAGCAAAYLVFEICFARRLGTGSRLLSTTVYYAVPYGIITVLGMYYHSFRKQTKKGIIAAGMLVYLFLAVYFYRQHGGYLSTQVYKYPPRLYYMSYGIAMSMLASYILESKSSPLYQSRLIRFISASSLWIYLWHIFYLKLVPYFVGNTWYLVYITVAACSMLTVYLQNLVVNYFEEQKKYLPLIRILKG
jgi:peptidoglycan/LPS O-acetylase OafA/YrhL